MEEPSDTFNAAADWLSTSPSAAKLSNEAKLELYGLYKLATVGLPDGARPSFFNPTARAKYDAWVEQAAKYPEAGEAKERYMAIAEELGWTRQSQGPKGMGVKVSTMTGDVEEPGASELHEAVLANDQAEVASLLKTPGLVNERDEYGNTPLHLAADRGLPEITALLLKHGADITAKVSVELGMPDNEDEDDQTPLELATITGRTEVAALLRDAS